MPPTPAEAHERVEQWFRANSSVNPTTLQDWTITEYHDALAFAPSGGRRSNQVILVNDTSLLAFAPSMLRIEDAYRQLVEESQGSRTVED